MKSHYFATFTIILALAANPVLAQDKTVITLHPSKDAPQISKHIYGHFAEHLGRCIYGGFYVGENSQVPNTVGIRNDVVEAMRAMKIPNLRWPGGCFADTYHWKDGIGPKESRPSMQNVWWGGITEDNSFGTHEFLNMCELLDAEPYLSGNVGSGSAQELSDWIKYTNHPAGSSPMPSLREKNGREKPWKVKFWGIGNEAWGCGGNMTPEYYSDEYRKYATFATDWSNSNQLVRVASGASSSDYNWTEVLMKNIPKNLIEAQTVNVLQAVILTDGNKLLLTPTYYVMKMYAVHQDATLIPLEFHSPVYTFNGESLPAVSASASINSSGLIHISLVNIDAKTPQNVELDVSALYPVRVKGEILTSAKLQDFNSFDNPNLVKTRDFDNVTLKNGMLKLSVPPFSVIVLEMAI